MAYFASIDKDDFETALQAVAKRYGFEEIGSLEDKSLASGIYIMVLDGIKRFYVG
jgi:hypothetical protein